MYSGESAVPFPAAMLESHWRLITQTEKKKGRKAEAKSD
jgi:hypothetical protein